MIELSSWTQVFLNVLEQTFPHRVWFAGLQGSYSRGEATETSDIDMVVILDTLCPADIQSYNRMLDSLPHRELICGFLSGKQEILNWDPADLFQFYHDTTPLLGSLDELCSLITDDAVARAITMGACNIYHGCVHNMLYDKSEEILKALYKSASFVIQAIHFQKTGSYIRHMNTLAQQVNAEDRSIIDTSILLKQGDTINFMTM